MPGPFFRSTAFALLATLTACSSAPTHFYTLLPPPQPAAATAHAPFAIEISPIGVPAEVDQNAWLMRVGTGQVVVLDNERWAAPLGAELHAAFTEALTRRTGARDLGGAPGEAGIPVYRIQIDVRRFESAAGKYALIEANWSVAQPGSPALARLECHSRISEPVGPGFEAIAIGHQRAVQEISAQIAQGLRSVVAGDSGCPRSES